MENSDKAKTVVEVEKEFIVIEGLVKNEHGGSQELPEKGNLFFGFSNIFSKKSSEDIFRNDNYDCN
jgi:hypothetical protein